MQIALNLARVLRARGEQESFAIPVQLPMTEAIETAVVDGQVPWIKRLESAQEAARNSFLMLFISAVAVSTVGGTTLLATLAWSLLIVTLFWNVGAVMYTSPVVHAAFSCIAFPIVTALFIISLIHAA
ncbi:hypothetical protein HKX48_005295 [Thoreauomyces humboldtii]|nr:hypothetical protein HKX48_005295 [Thoreauomyces humboldtii]